MPSPTSSARRLLVALVLLLAAGTVWAADASSHQSGTDDHAPHADDHDDHRPLATSATLGFAEILDATVDHSPQIRAAAARAAQADAYAGAGRGWLAGRPSVVANYYDDKLLDNEGQHEEEYGIQLPLWRPGEKADTSRLGEDYQRNSELWRQSLRLALAGQVRTLLADIDSAARMLDIERQSTADAERVLQVTTRLYETGALSKLDVMQSENLLLQQRQRELRAVAMMQDSEITYRMVTGLDTRPAAPHTEPMSASEEIPPTHPALQYLQSDIAVAADNVRQSEINARGNPQLTVGSRRERGDRFSPWIDTLSISLQIPFGGKSVVAARTSAARLQQADADVAYHSTLRQMQMALHEAEHELGVTRNSIPLAQRQADLDAERLALSQRAFATGELTLQQVLLVVQEARASARALAELQLKEQRLIADYNQVLGEMP